MGRVWGERRRGALARIPLEGSQDHRKNRVAYGNTNGPPANHEQDTHAKDTRTTQTPEANQQQSKSKHTKMLPKSFKNPPSMTPKSSANLLKWIPKGPKMTPKCSTKPGPSSNLLFASFVLLLLVPFGPPGSPKRTQNDLKIRKRSTPKKTSKKR